MRALKLSSTPGLKINRQAVRNLYARMYEHTLQQLGSLEYEAELGDRRALELKVDKYVRQRMKQYGFALH